MPKNIKLTCKEIAEIINGKIIGDENAVVTGLNRLEAAQKGELTFYANPKYAQYLEGLHATCVIVKNDFADNHNIKAFDKGTVFILVAKPYIEFVRVLKYLSSQISRKSHFIHDTAVIGENSKIAESAYIGPNCTIGDNCTIGENVRLVSNVSIYDNVSIGDNTTIHANVVCCRRTVIGKNCMINPGAVLGSEGFGFLDNADGSYEKIPQLGNVIIGDDVEIGANTTIDRAMIGSTVIERGVKMDNLVQIGHNVEVGENTAIVSQTGIAGSTKIGKRNRFGGQVGVSGHIETTDDVTIYAQSGLAKSVTEKGIYFGSPIKERITAFKIEATMNSLPQMARDVKKLIRWYEEYVEGKKIKD